MLHSIPKDKHGPLTGPMSKAVEACVHCGFCLAACPTYRELGQEMDTPRGRIVLMKEVLEGKLPWESAMPHIERCLGCLACEPACPSGVPYRDLISPFRSLAGGHVKRSAGEKLRRFVTSQTIPYPGRFRTAVFFGRFGKKLKSFLPGALRPMLEMLPDSIPARRRWPGIIPAAGKRRARVGLLTGCAQQVLAPDINDATIDVLTRNGVEVVIPQNQVCCGGLAWHGGDLSGARWFARKNLLAFSDDLNAIVTNAAGCGSAMHEYHMILRGTAEQEKAEKFRHRVVDVSAFLFRLGLSEPPGPQSAPRRIVYQDACHLAHAQNVASEPRALLRSIPGLEICEIEDSHICCGSAGTYNFDQPEIAFSLGEKKVLSILRTGASLVATGNIGCMTQVQAHLKRLGSPLVVRHTMQILRDAYAPQGEPSALRTAGL